MTKVSDKIDSLHITHICGTLLHHVEAESLKDLALVLEN